MHIARNLDRLEKPYFRKFRELLEARWFGENNNLAQRLGITTTTLYMYVNSGSTVKEPGQKLLDAVGETRESDPSTPIREVADGFNVDLDSDGEVIGFDIEHASKRFDLSTLETEAPPVRVTKAS